MHGITHINLYLYLSIQCSPIYDRAWLFGTFPGITSSSFQQVDEHEYEATVG